VKIVLVSPAHPLRGGIAASSERLASALQAAGHEVLIYSFSLQYPDFLFPGKTQYSDEPAPPGLKIITCINAINPFNWLLSGRKIAAENADIVIVRYWLPLLGPCLGTVLRIAKWLAPKTLRVTALTDNIIPHEKRPGDRLFSRYFALACHDFVVMSRAVGEQVRLFLPDKKRYDPSCVRFAEHPVYDIYGAPLAQQEARKLLNLPEKAQIILFFGFIRAYKGLDLLFDALASCPDIHALVAGECYEDWAPYAAQIHRLGLATRIHLHTDFIPSEQVTRYFSAADLVVQPYKTATQSGISQIAFHFEKPMVVTAVGGLPEIVKDGVSGYVVKPDPEAIGTAVRDFFEHQKAEQMREGVRKEKLRFSWENLVSVLLERAGKHSDSQH
jgi:D-inositol-3-phosphate glycosyltransferase